MAARAALALVAALSVLGGAAAQSGSMAASWDTLDVDPPPPPPVANAVVEATVSWPLTFNAGEHDTAAFRASFIAWLAAATGMPASTITVGSVSSGSVVVRFEMASLGGRSSVDALAALELAIARGVVAPFSHNGVLFPSPGLTITSQPTVLCDRTDVTCGVGIVPHRYPIADAACDSCPRSWNDVTRLATQSLAYPVTEASDAISTCTCDRTELHCDVTLEGGCGCDLDCSAAEVARFTARLPEGAISNRVEYCDTEGVLSLDTANLDSLGRSTVGDITLFSEFVDTQLCVIKENDPTIGVYYTDPVEIATAMLSLFTGLFARTPH